MLTSPLPHGRRAGRLPTSRLPPVRRIVFFAEAVTLAHVARCIALASSLDPERFEVILACDARYRSFFAEQPWFSVPLASISTARFVNALARGQGAYDFVTLQGYVRDDLAILDRCSPDFVIGDFRLSLSVSCRLARVPFGLITNAYWSPLFGKAGLPLPVLPVTRFLPLPVAQLLFDALSPLGIASQCRPFNRLRQANGLASLGSDLRRIYADADHLLYADPPSLFPAVTLPPRHSFIGPVLWSPPLPEPHWWAELPGDRPVVYVTLGSSGQASTLDSVLDALAGMPVTVIASTAGAALGTRRRANAFVADYLPGEAAAAMSQLVICNGGAPTCHQALAAGVPILGIASNMDQFLNMAAITRIGAGLLLRADRLSKQRVADAVMSLLNEPGFACRSAGIGTSPGFSSTGARFNAWLEQTCTA